MSIRTSCGPRSRRSIVIAWNRSVGLAIARALAVIIVWYLLMPGWSADHGLVLEVLLDSVAAHLAPDARALEPAVGRLHVDRGAVDPDPAGPDASRDGAGALGGAAPDGPAQAVWGVICDRDRLLLGVERDHHQD